MTLNPKTLDRLYRDGFDVDLDIQGAEFVKLGTGQLLFGNPVAPLPLIFDLTGVGVDSSCQLGEQDPLIFESELQKGNKLVVIRT